MHNLSATNHSFLLSGAPDNDRIHVVWHCVFDTRTAKPLLDLLYISILLGAWSVVALRFPATISTGRELNAYWISPCGSDAKYPTYPSFWVGELWPTLPLHQRRVLNLPRGHWWPFALAAILWTFTWSWIRPWRCTSAPTHFMLIRLHSLCRPYPPDYNLMH